MFPKSGAAPMPTTPAIDTRLLLEKSHRPAQQDQVKTLLLSAWIIGGCVMLVALVVAGVIIWFTLDQAPFVWFLLPLSFLAGILTAAVLSIMWIHKAAVRSWQLEDQDRYYRLRDIDDLYDLRRNLPDPPARDVVRVEVSQAEGVTHRTQIADLDAKPDQLKQLAVGLLSGQPFSESRWTGAGQPFSRGQFARLRAVFVSRGWANWRNPEAPAQGLTVTGPGWDVLKSLAGPTHPLNRVMDDTQNV